MKKIRLISTAFLILMLMGMLGGCSTDNSADTVVYGKIYTSDDSGTFAEACAIKDGKYIYVGDKEGVEEYIGENTQTVESEFVMPSGVESHSHIILEEAFKLGVYLDSYNEDGTMRTVDEILDDIVKFREENKDVEGIFAFGIDEECLFYMDEELDRKIIDEKISDIPVFISAKSLHKGFCNTKCLEKASALNDEIPAKTVERDENGTATGVIKDESYSYVRNAVFGEIGNYDQAVLNAQTALHSKGYTMLLDPWSNFDGTTAMSEAVLSADKQDKLQMVVFTSYEIGSYEYDDIDSKIDEAADCHNKFTSDRMEQKYVKLFADGVESSRTAYQLEPYDDGTYGVANWKDDQMNYVTENANMKGLLVHIHAYGDASARQAVNAYEESNNVNAKIYRNSLAHAPYVTDEDLERIAELGIGVSGCGNWATGCFDGPVLDYMNNLLGSERVKDYYIVDKYAEYGVKAGVSTDRPCVDGYAEDVFDYIGMLTTGVDYREGYQSPAKRDEWVSVEEAIRMITINGAWTLDADSERGSIEVGKYADFICADKDPFETDLKKINEIQVQSTYFEGNKVFEL